MTIFYHTTNSIGSGVRLAPTASSTHVVLEGVTIGSSDAEAIHAAFTGYANITLSILGHVFGEDDAISINDFSTQTLNADIYVGENAVISSSNLDGIVILSNDGTGRAEIENEGTIVGGDEGITALEFAEIYLTNFGTILGGTGEILYLSGHVVRVENSGTLQNVGSPSNGIVVRVLDTSDAKTFEFVNHGTLSANNAAIESRGYTDTIINSGEINGNLRLGEWESNQAAFSDSVTNTGSIFGSIFLGFGDDQVLGQTGFIEGTIKAGNGDDLIKSGTGDDMIIGGAGADEMWGGAGVDTASYEGSADGVRVSLNAGRGWFGQAQGDALHEIENLIGSDRQDTLIGNSAANMLEGGNADDILSAFGGDDTLFGGNGEDNIVGGNGNDYISGDRHRDRLTGGDGEDIFAFLNILDSGPANTERDNITDFTQGQDLIDLTALGDLFFGGTAFSGAAGEIIYYHVAGGTRTVVEIDTDGDSVADFGILLSNAAHTMTAADFLFV